MIIGLTGPQRAGKTTVSKILVRDFSAVFMSISEILQVEAHGYIGLPRFKDSEKDTPQESLNGHTPRELYVHIGQIDEYQPPLWANRMLKDKFMGPDVLHVVESVGKPAQWTAIIKFCRIQQCPCTVLNINRPGTSYQDNRSPVADLRGKYEIDNDGDVTLLTERVHKVMEHVNSNRQFWIPRENKIG